LLQVIARKIYKVSEKKEPCYQGDNQVVTQQWIGGYFIKQKSDLFVVGGNQDAENILILLQEYILLFTHCYHGTELLFQQDNASIYSLHKVTE